MPIFCSAAKVSFRESGIKKSLEPILYYRPCAPQDAAARPIKPDFRFHCKIYEVGIHSFSDFIRKAINACFGGSNWAGLTSPAQS